MAYDGDMTATPLPERSFAVSDLSEREKAMLFDLAMESAKTERARSADIHCHAAVIAAFARAYVLIRDREQGIV
jgi:hypothetical protein